MKHWPYQHWKEVPWRRVTARVRRLQGKLVKAERAGDEREVIRLQDQLVSLPEAKLLAVRQVTSTGGKHAAGVDGEVWSAPERKLQAAQQLTTQGYRPQPARRVNIPKGDGRSRPLGILTMRDRAMQALYLLALDPIAETRADSYSYGFRKHRSTADAITRCAEIWQARSSPGWVLEADIEKCFERISLSWLLEHIPVQQEVLRAWLRAGYLEKGRFHATTRGLPQGAVISPTLANMALDGLQRLLSDHFQYASARRGAHIQYVRFADDFIVTGGSKRMLRHEVYPLLAHFLEQRGMNFSSSKTRVTSLKQGVAFLGFFVQKTAFGGVRVTPTDKRVKAVLKTIRDLLAQHPQASPQTVIGRLNPIIRGWTTYYDHVDSRSTFDQLDDSIYELLLEWAKRRHPGYVNRRAVKEYFVPVKGHSPCFKDHQGRRLFRAHETALRQHVPLPPEYHPYDPAWEPVLARCKRQRAAQRASRPGTSRKK